MIEFTPYSALAGGAMIGLAATLLMLTLVIAGLDSFNPCAFFVLLFLIQLRVSCRSRMNR